jgi:hypothetical protein
VTRARHQALRVAYLSRTWPAPYDALLLDHLLVAFADTDPGAADTCAAQLLAQPLPELGSPDSILERARAAGAPDVDTWPERARQPRRYDRRPEECVRGGAQQEAERLWAGLRTHLPQIAEAFAGYVRALPDDWREYLLATRAREQAAPAPAAEGYLPAETAAVEHTEDCPACGEVQDMCRYHRGWEQGLADARKLLGTAATDPSTHNDLLDRARRAGGGDLLERLPDGASLLLRLLAEDNGAWSELRERHDELAYRAPHEDQPDPGGSGPASTPSPTNHAAAAAAPAS